MAGGVLAPPSRYRDRRLRAAVVRAKFRPVSEKQGIRSVRSRVSIDARRSDE
ncbi:hypothetical protein HPDFL43_00028090 [Hoeflea phototrophica DFL-43]|uniref:Uncharacterized protein n=1 Tax=Hoeflea phototrophica (strain DSM 17068 / NCIMB 14078 / DFL-43) TaxID=411684 RepID=A0A095BDY7_HOEPD|nr:hypothetical protein HPDFL43_00028090 [Hoeflea phototrophica DFL-43]